MKRCMVDSKRVWPGLGVEFLPGRWVCSRKCYEMAASAVEFGMDLFV